MNTCHYCSTKILQNSLESNGYTIFIKPGCPYSKNALKMLNSINATYTCYNLEHVSCYQLHEALKQLLTKKGKRFTVPQIYFNAKYIGGRDDLYKFLKKHKLIN